MSLKCFATHVVRHAARWPCFRVRPAVKGRFHGHVLFIDGKGICPSLLVALNAVCPGSGTHKHIHLLARAQLPVTCLVRHALSDDLGCFAATDRWQTTHVHVELQGSACRIARLSR